MTPETKTTNNLRVHKDGVDVEFEEDRIRFHDGNSYVTQFHIHDHLQITIPLEHSSFEISWGANKTLEQKILTAGSICIIPPFLPHKLSWFRKANFINLHVSLKTVMILLGDLYDLDKTILSEQIGIRDPFLLNLGRSLVQVFKNHEEKAIQYYKSALNLSLHHVYENFAAIPKKITNNAYPQAEISPKIRDVINYIHSNYYRNLTTKELAAVGKMSPFHFIRKFQRSIGVTPSRFHLLCRMEIAKDMLVNTDKSIALISKELGFSSQGYFGAIFLKNFANSPVKFRLENS